MPIKKKSPSPRKDHKKGALRTQKKSTWNRSLHPSPRPKKSKDIDLDKLPSFKEEDQTASEIVRRLREALSPSLLTILNLTAQHASHQKSNKSRGGHYRLELVSDLFEGLKKIQRERWVQSIVEDLLETKKIHALSMSLKATGEVKGIYGL